MGTGHMKITKENVLAKIPNITHETWPAILIYKKAKNYWKVQNKWPKMAIFNNNASSLLYEQ